MSIFDKLLAYIIRESKNTFFARNKSSRLSS